MAAQRYRRPGNGSAGARTWVPVLLVVVLAVATALAWVGRDRRDPPGAAASGAYPPGASSAGFGATDTAWIQIMIPMNEQLLAIVDLVPGRGADTQFHAVAQRVAASRRAELTDLYRLRERAGLPATNVHEGHDMPGMVTGTELDTMRAQHDRAFDTAVRDPLREHLDQGARLAASETAYGAEPETRQLAGRVEDTRRTELGLLTATATA
jgi:uncharacterized protein (DUF305 family)